MEKNIYFFGDGKADGSKELRNLLGGKGCDLAEMIKIGIPVPPGFTISTAVCTHFYDNKFSYPTGIEEELKENLRLIEGIMKKKFGDENNPLLVSVRSGARVSMPGMMDTVLNLGLNDKTVMGLIKASGDERFAYDCYRRFVQMYGDVVLGLKPTEKEDIDPFEAIIEHKKRERGITLDVDLDSNDLRDLVLEFKEEIRKNTGKDFPEDEMEQLWGAIGAVFRSWNNPRAIAYRQLNQIPSHWGTAVTVQTMVFGNTGTNSATGVAFTRDPATGENIFYGEYLRNAQGEDVVAGIRTPQPLNIHQRREKEIVSLEEEMPFIYRELEVIRKRLESHYRDMQDIEFTIEAGKLWILQTRSGKRTGFAAFRIAAEMVNEGLIEKEEAIRRVETDHLNHLLRPVFDPKEKKRAIDENRLLTKGLNAGPGAAVGKVVFNALDAEEWTKGGEEVILVRMETSPEDIRGMNAAQGILTSRGGMTSHAALVARQMGKVCVAGCGDLKIDARDKTLKVKDRILKEGDYISIDGTTGEVIEGKILTAPSEILQVLLEKTQKEEASIIYQRYKDLMRWADEIRSLRIRANADKPDQAEIALSFGAEGIGLCRTEHMFFEEDRIDCFRAMILADDGSEREKALSLLLPFQKKDFMGIFKVMGSLPCTIRLLDPPLHEFLPHTDSEIKRLAEKMGLSHQKIKDKAENLRESNPMLGHRGCRLGITFPEIYEMQIKAIIEACCELRREGLHPNPEIMIPLVATIGELSEIKMSLEKVAREVMERYNDHFPYSFGTMIEIPRAAITADEIAEQAEFFSFGTNDLTQTVFGLSRDDAGTFLPHYLQKEILSSDPFVSIDEKGVGEVMRIGVTKGRIARPNLKIGICGEHGGDPSSIEFCHHLGLDYVSCSPYRVPIARLAAAKAALKLKDKGQ